MAESQTDGNEKDEGTGTAKILLQNLPPDIGEDSLTLYLEDDENLGIDVQNVDMLTDSSAVVELTDPDAAELVLKKQPLNIDGQNVDVELYNQPKSVKTIAVTGFSDVITERQFSMVKMYFKNEKRSGGGKIVRSSFERGVAFFTFENAEVTERVLARKTHTFDGHQLDVRMSDDTSSPPPINQNSSVIISNIPEEVTADTEYMTSYFDDEDTFGEVLRVKTVDLDTEKRKTIVEFVDETAVELVLEHQPLYMGPKLNRLCIEKYSTRETNTETTCIIEVNGPSHLIKQDNLKMLNAYFNSTERSGGGKVIKSLIENGCAYFTFETGEVARRVASKRNHSLKKGPLDVRIFEGYISHKRALSSRSRSKTIEVHSIDEKALETMQFYFENSKRSGGGHIIDCKMDSRRNCAFFTFEKKDDARNVAARNHCKFGVDVKLLDDEMDEGSPMNMTKNLHENTKTVKVMNVGRDIKGETLQFYFENTSRSGGGEIESITRYDDDDQLVYYITFVSEKDAVSVSAKSHLVQEHTLRVMLYVQPPAYENKLLIKGLSEKTTKEGLEHYLEATACLQPVSISFSEHDDDIALVTFKSKPDFEKVTNVCQSRPLDGAELRISKVPVSNCIFVSNIATDVTEDTVMFYFENTNKSGGGTVEKVTFNRPEGTCLVYFADYKVIEEVISRNHELSRQSLTVNRYLACLKGFESNVERKLVIPGPLYVAFSDVDGLPYLSKTGKMAELVEEELRKHHTKIIWPLGKEDKHVKLECILTKDVSRCYQLAKNWEMQSKKCLIDMMNQFSLRRIDILQVVWQRVIDFVKTIKIENPQNVSLFYENENPIVVFGRPDAVEYVDEAIKSKVDELTRDEVEKIEQKTYYSQIKLKFMIKYGIKEDILKQFNDLRIHTDDTSGEIAFIGPVRSVSKATAFTSKLSRSLFTRTLENVSDRALNLYKSKEATNYIQKKLKDNNKYCVFDVVDNTVLTCGKDKTMLEDCIKLIEESVLECEIKCQRDHVPDFKSESWERLVASILANNQGKVEICLPDDTEYVLVCTTDDLKDDVCKEIQNFILSHTIKSRRISHSPEESKFIATYRQRELDKIATGLSKFYVEIKAINYNSFEFCGLDEGVNIAIKEFEALADSVKRRRHKVQKPGIRDHITSPKGNEILHTIEKTLECVIVVEEEARWKITEGCNVLAECEAFPGRKIYACLGDITNIKTDVLVNPQDEDMTFSGRLGSVICSKGGPSIQRSCNGHGKLNKGDVFICDGGKLKAKYTANVRSQSWNGGQNEEEKLLTMTICKCLHESSLKQTAKSIAFPAVGCGSNGFPADVTARCLVKAIRTYFQDNKESQIDTIFLCDKTMRTVTGFSEALSSEFGYKNVIKHDIQVEYEAKATGTQLQQHGDITNSMPSKSKVSRRKRMSAENRITGNKSAKHSGGSKSGDDFRYGGVKISIIKGNIAEQRVDVIVNTASRNLDLSQGAVSKSILTAGGVGLKKEIATKYPKGISGTNVAITSGHKLNCSILIHIALDQFDANNVTGSMNDLHEVIGNCFKEARRSHHSSIVLPAMGTGNLGYPRDLVAKELFVSALDFCKQNPRTSISDIIFIVHPSDTASIQAFEAEKARRLAELALVSKGVKYLGPRDAYRNDNIMTSETFIFDNVSVALKAGDLTEDDAKCIVCWLEECMNTKGAVTTALLKKCGQLLADELDNIKQHLTTNKIGFTSAPGLKSEFIMHVAVKPCSVRETMIKCLKKAEEEKIESVAFPALAASRKGLMYPSADLLSNMMYLSAGIPDVYTTNEGTLTLSQISKEMTKGVKEFAKTKPKYLTDIRFVIYQPSMMDDFRKALGKGFDAKDNLAGTFFKGARYCIGKMMSNTNEEQTERNTVTFDILSTSDEVIQQAIRKLDSSLEKEILTKTFNDDIIQHLDESQILELMNIARQQQVVADIDIAKRIVTITGMSNNMLDASDKFHLFFKEAIQMDLIADIAQWYVIIISKTGEEVVPYEKEVNLQLERAYRQKKKYVIYTSEDVEYVVDFDAMEEYPKNDKDDVAKVIRRESFKPRSFPLPTTWDDMNGVNLRVVTLKPTSKEYDEIEQTFLKSAAKRATYIVNKIDRIQNVTLWEQYMTKKKQLDEQNPPGTQNEQLLWHGTREDAVDSINAHGFNRRFCGENATAYGNGVYFAVDASYSCSETYSRPNRNGIKRMYYCRVLSGEYAKGESGMKVPPPKPSGGHHALFDSVVNNMMNPNMFVIFHDTQACPEYLIQFKSA